MLLHSMGGDGSMTDLWIYVVGPILGGLGAAGLFGAQEGEGARSS
jgi:glycerol uptake facilitator-like aquaporin